MTYSQGVKARMLGRQNVRNFCYVRLALTSIFGLYFVAVCLIKSNCYSLIYSSLDISYWIGQKSWVCFEANLTIIRLVFTTNEVRRHSPISKLLSEIRSFESVESAFSLKTIAMILIQNANLECWCRHRDVWCNSF